MTCQTDEKSLNSIEIDLFHSIYLILKSSKKHVFIENIIIAKNRSALKIFKLNYPRFLINMLYYFFELLT